MNWTVHYDLIPRVSVMARLRSAGFSVTVHPDAVTAAVLSVNAGVPGRLTASVEHRNPVAMTLFLLQYPDLRMTVDD